MRKIESSDRHQYAVMWVPSGYSQTGDKTVSEGTELAVRWEDNVSSRRPDKGDEIEFDARIVINQDITVGSLFWLGKESELPDPVTEVTRLFEVVEFRKTPDVKGRNYRRVCYLKKWSNTLPTIS
jgi:hypothetical protein